MDIDFRVTQLLASRICHDLAGGVGAMTAGTELLAEEDGPPAADALDLISASAQQTSRRLQFLRVAFGQGGGEDGRATLSELIRLTHGYLTGSRVSVVWEGEDARVDLGLGKLLLNLCLIGADCLPRGGVLCVDANPLDDDAWGLAVRAQGQGAALPPDLAAAITTDADVAGLTPRTVHGHFAAVLCRNLGGQFEIEPGEDGEIHLAALVPKAP